jgi:hypothetical protein
MKTFHLTKHWHVSYYINVANSSFIHLLIYLFIIYHLFFHSSIHPFIHNDRNAPPHSRVQTISSLLSSGYRGLFSHTTSVKVIRRSHALSITKVRNPWSFTFTDPSILTAWYSSTEKINRCYSFRCFMYTQRQINRAVQDCIKIKCAYNLAQPDDGLIRTETYTCN